jgi:hypothetical protein
MSLRKDEILDRLAERGSVAQFISYRPDDRGAPLMSFNRLAGASANASFSSMTSAIEALFARSPEGTVNVRSYTPDSPRSREFLYGLQTVDDVVAAINRLTSEGLHTIANETVNVADGGVSGVVQGDTVEFAPDDTPRCVEKPGVASLPFDLAIRLLSTVYGFVPDLQCGKVRTEFSIHPLRRGTRQSHTLLWEQEENVGMTVDATMQWPNRFSRHIGDKAYGLLMAWMLGLKVPYTTAIPRRLAPFSFGTPTGSHEIWTRTCPVEPRPGLYTTTLGWIDPFSLLGKEDPDGTQIASLLSQAAVPAAYAGAAIVGPQGLIVEGKAGSGDSFMLGVAPPEALPDSILDDITSQYDELSRHLGAVRFEWVHDGSSPWLVQLHRGATGSSGSVIVPGDADHWVPFKVTQGLEALRTLVENLPKNSGIELVGEVGLTSHFADLVRKVAVPTRTVTEKN